MGTNQKSLANKNASKFTSSSHDFYSHFYNKNTTSKKSARVLEGEVVRLTERFKALDLRFDVLKACVGFESLTKIFLIT